MQTCPTLALIGLMLWNVPKHKIGPTQPSAWRLSLVPRPLGETIAYGAGATLLYMSFSQLACALSEEIPALTCP